MPELLPGASFNAYSKRAAECLAGFRGGKESSMGGAVTAMTALSSVVY